ncbi:MAG: GGDEF domain-containing protein [Aliihoeflea sp.]
MRGVILRSRFTFGRMGGEEFLLFLPNCSVADATHRLQKILDDVKSIRFGEATGYSCSFSAGLCEVQPDKTLDETLSLANKYLYAAKAAGRQFIVSGPASMSCIPSRSAVDSACG